MPSGFMYILECSDGSYYTGSTVDINQRFFQHQSGEGANYTKDRLPVKLVYCEEYDRIDEAFYREKQVQGWSHDKKKALIEGRFNDIHSLAECRNESHYKNVSLDSARETRRQTVTERKDDTSPDSARETKGHDGC